MSATLTTQGNRPALSCPAGAPMLNSGREVFEYATPANSTLTQLDGRHKWAHPGSST